MGLLVRFLRVLCPTCWVELRIRQVSKNRSDGPSRNRPVAPPDKEEPLWYTDLRRGDTGRFDICLAAARVPKNPSRWLRMLLLLAGDIEPRPGPAPKPRGPLDLQSGFAASTRHKMQKSLDAFATRYLAPCGVQPAVGSGADLRHHCLYGASCIRPAPLRRRAPALLARLRHHRCAGPSTADARITHGGLADRQEVAAG